MTTFNGSEGRSENKIPTCRIAPLPAPDKTAAITRVGCGDNRIIRIRQLGAGADILLGDLQVTGSEPRPEDRYSHLAQSQASAPAFGDVGDIGSERMAPCIAQMTN